MDRVKIFYDLIKHAGLSETEWLSRVNIHKKLSKIYQDEINKSGGIYGKSVDLSCGFCHGNVDEVSDQIIDYLKEDDYSVVISSGGQKRYDKIVETLNAENFLFFSVVEQVQPKDNYSPYFFQCATTSREAKVKSAIHVIKEDFKGDSIHFFHEGARFKTDLLPLLSTLKNPLFEHNVSLKKIGEISNLNPLIQKITDKDLLILDITALKTIHVINYLNDHHKRPTVLKLYGGIDGRVDKYNFPMIEVGVFRRENLISLQALSDRIDKNSSARHKTFIADGLFRLDIPLLLSYASKKRKNGVNNKNEFISSVREDLNKIDGINDIFIGKAYSYSFNNCVNTIKSSVNYLIPESLQRDGQITRTYYPTQFVSHKDKLIKANVNYAYIDIIRITKVDITDGIWCCEFFLDLNTVHVDPLKFIKFNNQSLIDSKFEAKLVKQTEDEKFGATNYRYYVVANFDFLADADNYPFDTQYIYISMSISDSYKYGILQPIPDTLKDNAFQVDGWKLMDAKTGIMQRKEILHQNANLEQHIEIREEVRAGWTIGRANAITALKVGVPMLFLILLNYYVAFISYENILTSIGILTTTFLSGIALYFSTENPAPLRITTIDMMFIYYYLQVGIISLATGVSGFVDEPTFNFSMLIIKYMIPILLIIFSGFLWWRINSGRYSPRMDY